VIWHHTVPAAGLTSLTIPADMTAMMTSLAVITPTEGTGLLYSSKLCLLNDKQLCYMMTIMHKLLSCIFYCLPPLCIGEELFDVVDIAVVW